MIVGTAGHVDHGKTSLIHALTGVATDRLKEEQARGLTIEAGYAYPEPPPGQAGAVLGFIDVPGHERFVANMLSGAVGIQAMLLVIAADDGIMPQTLEHARILELLGVTQAWVALTKIDRVTPARIDEVRREIAAWLDTTAFAGAPIFPLSSVTGAGLQPLESTLWAQAAQPLPVHETGRFRIAVDRVFVKQGAGVVVTGTVRSGRVALGDKVRLLPGDMDARVRGLRAQDREVDLARPGERCAINLSGSGIERSRLARGNWVVAAASRAADRTRLDVALDWLPEAPALRHWTPVHLHHGSAHVTGRVALLEADTLDAGGSALAQLVLDSPLQAIHGDRIVIRDHGASRTLGGARVLDVAPPRRGARKPDRLIWLSRLREVLSDGAGPPDWQPLFSPRRELENLEMTSVDLAALAVNLDVPVDDVQRSASAAHWLVLSNPTQQHALAPIHERSLYDDAIERLASIHEQEPAMRGVDIDRLRRMVAPRLPADLFRPLLEHWKARGDLAQHGPFVALASHTASLSAQDEKRWDAVRPLLMAQPYDPPRVRDIAGQLGWAETDVRRLLHDCALLGNVYQLRHDHFFLASRVSELAAVIRQIDGESPAGATAAVFRDRIGCGRKLAVAILEFFDRIGFTRRVGDGHKVIRDDMLFE